VRRYAGILIQSGQDDADKKTKKTTRTEGVWRWDVDICMRSPIAIHFHDSRHRIPGPRAAISYQRTVPPRLLLQKYEDLQGMRRRGKSGYPRDLNLMNQTHPDIRGLANRLRPVPSAQCKSCVKIQLGGESFIVVLARMRSIYSCATHAGGVLCRQK